MIQQNNSNANEVNHPNPLCSGIGTFTQRKICGIHFYYILLDLYISDITKNYFITGNATEHNMNKGMT